jgi:hypothetical protein
MVSKKCDHFVTIFTLNEKTRAEMPTPNALILLKNYWSGRLDLNQRPLHPEGMA